MSDVIFDDVVCEMTSDARKIEIVEPVVVTGQTASSIELEQFEKATSNCLGCFVVLVFVSLFAFMYGVYYIIHM